MQSRRSAVGIASRLRAGPSRVRILARIKEILSYKSSRPTLKLIQPPVQWVRAFFLGGKAAGGYSQQ